VSHVSKDTAHLVNRAYNGRERAAGDEHEACAPHNKNKMLARKLSLDEHALISMEEDALRLRGNVDFMRLERTLWL
jgi:hypothetical protein